ncbi:MAG: (d)CMP kinase [Metamycoplasmataceae bacterium]
MKINIAIDGPSGVGKSTLAKNIAKEFDLIFVNTGLMYRAIAFYFLNKNKINDLNYILKNIKNIKIKLLPNEEILLNEENITNKLWVDEISKAASTVAKIAEIRKFCVKFQQEIAKNKNVVMEGRDIGSVVIPNAEIKFFLIATPEERAKRRIVQLKEKNINFNEEDILNNIKERDFEDTNRKNDPLIQVKDAILIDTSKYNLKEVEQIMFAKIRERL